VALTISPVGNVAEVDETDAKSRLTLLLGLVPLTDEEKRTRRRIIRV